MYEGKPLVLLVGGTDTGRTPMAAGLLRRALGAGVVVRTAGVLSHEGEGAMPEAQMALDQLGIDISRHISRPLRREEHRHAELILAVDRGTELVLFSEFPNDPRVGCLPALAEMPDVLDPHRMPLGVWISAVRQLNDQIAAALPRIRERLGIAEQEPLPFVPRKVERRRSNQKHDPLVLGTGHKMEWDRDEDMQRLLELIGGAAEPAAPSTPPLAEQRGGATQRAGAQPKRTNGEAARRPKPAEREPTQEVRFASKTPPVELAAPALALPAEPPAAAPAPTEPELPQGDRASHVKRMVKLLETAEELPEVVDWSRLRQEVVSRLRAIARQSSGPLDFTPAATMMIEGKLVQLEAQPGPDALFMLRKSIKRLDTAVNPTGLAAIGGELAEW